MNGAHRTMLVSSLAILLRVFTGLDDRAAIIVGQSVPSDFSNLGIARSRFYASICMVPEKSRIVRGRLILISRSRKLDLGEAVAYDFHSFSERNSSLVASRTSIATVKSRYVLDTDLS